LEGYVGQSIQLRFLYVRNTSLTTFSGTADSGNFIMGWFVDQIAVVQASGNVVLAEGGEAGLGGVTTHVPAGYNLLSSNVYADAAFHSFHFAHTDYESQWTKLNPAVVPLSGSVLKFKSRLGWAGVGQSAHVQVSRDSGASWADVFVQNGTDGAGELVFNDRTVGLESYVGQSIQIRFLYVRDTSMTTFAGAGDSGNFIMGWFVDQIAVTGAGSAAVAPLITSQPQNQTVVEGANVNFSVLASGTAPFSYQWRKNGTPINGATSSTLTLSRVTMSNASDYSVTVANSGGTATSNAAALAVIRVTSPTVTDDSSFSLAGITQNPGRILSVLVNGAPVRTSDGFATWSASTVNLNDGLNSFTIEIATNPNSTGSGSGASPNAAAVLVWQVFYATSANLLQYALTTNAGNTNAGLSPSIQHESSTGADYLTFSYRRRMETANLLYSVEISDDMQSWHLAMGTEIEQLSPPVGNPDGVTETVTIRVKPQAGERGIPQRFARVRVTVP
jgi:hypothetical protein